MISKMGSEEKMVFSSFCVSAVIVSHACSSKIPWVQSSKNLAGSVVDSSVNCQAWVICEGDAG